MAQLDVNTCFTYAYSAGTYADFVQDVTADAASTNYIDLKTAGITISGGSKMPWIIVKVGATAFAGSVSIEIRLQTDSDSGFATTLRDVALLARPVLASLTAGATIVNQALPHFDYQRYMRLYFNVFTNATAGGFIAWLSDGPEPAVTDYDQVQAAS